MLLGLGGCQVATTDHCTLHLSTEVPLRYQHGNLFTAPLLNDQATSMVFDTGAEDTVLSRSSASRLHLPLRPSRAETQGVGGTQEVYGFDADTYQIGTLHGTGFPLQASDLGSVEHGGDGLLGADFLAAYDIDLDLPERKAVLYKPVNGCRSPSTALHGDLYSAPLIYRDRHSPRTNVVIGGKTLVAVLDTGAASTVIFRDGAERLGLRIDRLPTDRKVMFGGIGPHVVPGVRHVMSPMTIGELTVSNFPVVILDQDSPPDTEMLIGLNFFYHIHTWFSFSSHTLIMQYPPLPSGTSGGATPSGHAGP